jgi:DNA helicase-2/ATP-dependent DNA helicase PcrA
MALLDDLNPQQREAVLATDGPVLVLAGAGSGKTRVITYRVAYLISQSVPPDPILSVTFTNKAAEQMRQRVAALLRGTGHPTADPWIGTFHSFCARLLRREAPRLGLRRDFAIYDQDDQEALVKEALRQLGYNPQTYPPGDVLGLISYAKNKRWSHAHLAREAFDRRGEVTAQVYERYDAILRKVGAVDFDDLLLKAVEVLERFPDAAAHWSHRYRYIQVDEYQDTNRLQYELVRLLSTTHRNLCVVGDEDQSIYSWRGAAIENILCFEEDFPGTRLFRLEENYRSTQNILDAAGAVVKHNARRIGKTLLATRGTGANLRFFEAHDGHAEADFVCEEASRLLRRDPGCHVAVLYRTNFQSRAFEEELRRMSVRYRVVGGFSFYQRAEVKDTMAYVRLAINPADDVALVRVLNTPPRGIGSGSVEKLRAIAQEHGISLWQAIERAAAGPGARSNALRTFRQLMEDLRNQLGALLPHDFLRYILDQTGYLTLLEQQDFAQDSSRADNVRELVNAVAEGAERGETLTDFLDRTALVSDADDYLEEIPVSLMTLHSAKGLEFDHVFLVGLEEGLLPHTRSSKDEEALEEERRLCYVGMTRAKDSLTLTRALYRRGFGANLSATTTPSRFLREIPPDLVETAAGSLAEVNETRRYVPDPESDEGAAYRRFARPARNAAATRRSTASSKPRRSPLIGTRVRHPKFGLGTILSVEGEGDDRQFTVSFSDYGTKKLRERYAHLERA